MNSTSLKNTARILILLSFFLSIVSSIEANQTILVQVRNSPPPSSLHFHQEPQFLCNPPSLNQSSSFFIQNPSPFSSVKLQESPFSCNQPSPNHSRYFVTRNHNPLLHQEPSYLCNQHFNSPNRNQCSEPVFSFNRSTARFHVVRKYSIPSTQNRTDVKLQVPVFNWLPNLGFGAFFVCLVGLLQWICCCCSRREANVVNNYSVINPNPLLAQERSEERIEDVKESTSKSLGKSTGSPQSGVGVEYNLEQLKTITRNFSQLLHTGHSGLFYQGIIGGEDIEAGNTQVVVKRITEGNYVEELSVFNQLKGPKSRLIVELIGYCSEGGHYLVFESMDGDLSKLFGSSAKYLDGRTRIMIARDIADGLTYLHNECAMAHRDIQPSSVLLDKNLQARLGSLNQATENGHQEEGIESSLHLLDSVAFGKLLLLLVTGSAEAINDEKWTLDVLECGPDQVVDKKLIQKNDNCIPQLKTTLVLAKALIQKDMSIAKVAHQLEELVQQLEELPSEAEKEVKVEAEAVGNLGVEEEEEAVANRPMFLSKL